MTVASTFVDAFRFMGDNRSLLLHTAAGLSELAFAALGIALVVALPLALWLGHKHRGLFLALGVSTLGRALPSIALIGLFIAWLGVGFWNVAVVLVVLAVPPILANGYFAVEGVDRDVVEAARGMGLTEAQILLRVELPLGLPLILAGVRIAAIFVIATATIAAVAGLGGGLGDIIVNQASYGEAGVLAGALWVAAIALLTGLVVGLAQRAASRRMAPRA
ncbi:MAG TPA: ABC transporter permease subunit [Gaiellaceae bacterium]|nr:ABC transporter permease subunit [Gaiellaceae bacterium]